MTVERESDEGTLTDIMDGQGAPFEAAGEPFIIRQPTTEEYDDALAIQNLVLRRTLALPEVAELRELPCSDGERASYALMIAAAELEFAEAEEGRQKDALMEEIARLEQIVATPDAGGRGGERPGDPGARSVVDDAAVVRQNRPAGLRYEGAGHWGALGGVAAGGKGGGAAGDLAGVEVDARGPFLVGSATRAKIRLAERFGAWPLAGGPGALTAAQAMVLAAALAKTPPATGAEETNEAPAAFEQGAPGGDCGGGAGPGRRDEKRG